MKKIVLLISFILSGTLLVQLASCRHDPITPLEEAPRISYSQDIQPVIISNCTQTGCHGSHEFPLATYDDVMKHVTAGKPHKSGLYSAVTANAGNVMPVPPNPRLSDSQIKQIYLWILQGANKD